MKEIVLELDAEKFFSLDRFIHKIGPSRSVAVVKRVNTLPAASVKSDASGKKWVKSTATRALELGFKCKIKFGVVEYKSRRADPAPTVPSSLPASTESSLSPQGQEPSPEPVEPGEGLEMAQDEPMEPDVPSSPAKDPRPIGFRRDYDAVQIPSPPPVEEAPPSVPQPAPQPKPQPQPAPFAKPVKASASVAKPVKAPAPAPGPKKVVQPVPAAAPKAAPAAPKVMHAAPKATPVAPAAPTRAPVQAPKPVPTLPAKRRRVQNPLRRTPWAAPVVPNFVSNGRSGYSKDPLLAKPHVERGVNPIRKSLDLGHLRIKKRGNVAAIPLQPEGPVLPQYEAPVSGGQGPTAEAEAGAGEAAGEAAADDGLMVDVVDMEVPDGAAETAAEPGAVVLPYDPDPLAEYNFEWEDCFREVPAEMVLPLVKGSIEQNEEDVHQALYEYARYHRDVAPRARLALWEDLVTEFPAHPRVWASLFDFVEGCKPKSVRNQIKRGIRVLWGDNELLAANAVTGCHFFERAAIWLIADNSQKLLLELVEVVRAGISHLPEIPEELKVTLFRCEDRVFAPAGTSRSQIVDALRSVWAGTNNLANLHDAFYLLCTEHVELQNDDLFTSLLKYNHDRIQCALLHSIQGPYVPGIVEILELLLAFALEQKQEPAETVHHLYNIGVQCLREWQAFSRLTVDTWILQEYPPTESLLDYLESLPVYPELMVHHIKWAKQLSLDRGQETIERYLLASDMRKAAIWLELSRLEETVAARNLLSIALDYVTDADRHLIWQAIYTVDPSEDVLSGWLTEDQSPEAIGFVAQAIFERDSAALRG